MATAASTGSNQTVFPNRVSTNPNLPSHTPLPTPQSQSQTLEAAKDIAFGSTAGILGKFVEYPFDTIKVRLQSQKSSPQNSTRLQSPLDVFAAAWRSSEGPLKNLYHGISAPLFGAAVETSSLFFSYRIAQDILVSTVPSLRTLENKGGSARVSLPFSALLVAGATSGAFTSFLLTPIELVKCKLQVLAPSPRAASDLGYTTPRPPGPLQLIRLILRSHGLLGFWHGQLGTLIRETGGSAAWFGSYEGVKILFERYNTTKLRAEFLHGTSIPPLIHGPLSPTSISQQLLAGAAAGISYNFFFYPADTIKSRMQTEETAATAATGTRPTRFLTVGRELWRTQGLRGFYSGCGITVFRAAPSSAIIFSIYEGLRGAVG
jgi:mitochondrial ornithine carrier protein